MIRDLALSSKSLRRFGLPLALFTAFTSFWSCRPRDYSDLRDGVVSTPAEQATAVDSDQSAAIGSARFSVDNFPQFRGMAPRDAQFVMQRWATNQGGYWDDQRWFAADFNGDGRTDFAKVFNCNGPVPQGEICIDVHVSNGAAFTMQRWATKQGGYWTAMKWFVADFDGDGKADFADLFDCGNGTLCADIHRSTGTAFVLERWATNQSGYWQDMEWFVGDFNGDRRMDFGKVFNCAGPGGKPSEICIDMHLSTGKNFTAARWATRQGGYWPTMKWFVGDFDGDGKSDLADAFSCSGPVDGGTICIDMHRSTGTAFAGARWATNQGGFWNAQKWFAGDFNGDGKTDLATVFGDVDGGAVDVHQSTGASFIGARWASEHGGYWDSQRWFAADFNGDQHTDFAKVFEDGPLASIDGHISFGSYFDITGTNAQGNYFRMSRMGTQQGGYWAAQRWFTGDFNGDGLTDLAKIFNDRNGGPASIDVHVTQRALVDCARAGVVDYVNYCPNDPAYVGQWSNLFNWPNVGIHVAVLPNGKVLSFDRSPETDNGTINQPTRNAYLWDPATPAAFTNIPYPSRNLFCSGHAFLPDGRLLITGGHIKDGWGIPDTTIFDYRTNTWKAAAAMNAGRWYPTNVPLGNGDMLVSSGTYYNGKNIVLNEFPQIFNGNTWRTLTGAKRAHGTYPIMFQAPDGRIVDVSPDPVTRFLDPNGLGKWTDGPRNAYAGTYRTYASAVMFEPGKILLAGGGDVAFNPDAGVNTRISRLLELLDVTLPNPKWQTVGAMIHPRKHANTTLMADGKVFISGGTWEDTGAGPVYVSEIWDPETYRSTEGPPLATHRLYHSTQVLLPDGRLLSTGGGQPAMLPPDQKNAQLYSPAYLFRGPRPVIAAAPDRIGYNGTFNVTSANAAAIRKINLIRLSAVTHSFNQNQRISRLAFTVAGNTLQIRSPRNGNELPPGHYMLFILNDLGVPSVAKVLQLL